MERQGSHAEVRDRGELHVQAQAWTDALAVVDEAQLVADQSIPSTTRWHHSLPGDVRGRLHIAHRAVRGDGAREDPRVEDKATSRAAATERQGRVAVVQGHLGREARQDRRAHRAHPRGGLPMQDDPSASWSCSLGSRLAGQRHRIAGQRADQGRGHHLEIATASRCGNACAGGRT